MTKIYLDRNVEDVNITTPADNNLLAWDEATQRWVNTALTVTAGRDIDVDNTDPLAPVISLETELDDIKEIHFDTTVSGYCVEGCLHWNTDDGTLEIGMPGGSVNLQIGQENLIKVTNKTGVTIPNGTAVFVTGAQGQRPTISGAIASTNVIANALLGVATEDIAHDHFGYVSTQGLVRDVDTSAFTEGSILYLSASNSGALTMTAPSAPNTVVGVAICVYQHATEGILGVFPRILSTLATRTILTDTNDNFTSTHVEGALEELSNMWDYIDRYGFVEDQKPPITFNDTTYTLTFGDIGTMYPVFLDGTVIERIRDTCALPTSGGAPVAGTYYFYLDETMNLVQSTDPWDLSDKIIPVAIVIWNDALTPKYILLDERHTASIDRKDHRYNHLTRGTQLVDDGGLSGYSTASSSNANNTFGVGESIIADEDLFHTLAELVDEDGANTPYLCMYRDSGSYVWSWSAMPYLWGTDYIKYDNAGTLTEGANAKYYNWYLVYTNAVGDGRFILIPGRGEFSSANAAYAEDFGTFSGSGLPLAEFVGVYQLTFVTNSSYAANGKCKLERNPFRIIPSNNTTSSYASSIDHNALAGLEGGATGDYYHLTGTQATDLTDGGATTLHSHALATHATTHQNGGTDEVATATPAANAIPKAGAGGTLATGWLPDATTSAKGIVELATSAETTAGLAVQASDTRLSDARTPTAHNILNSTYHGDTLTGSATRGDIIYGNSTPKWARLAKGTSGYVLTAGASDISWAAIPNASTSAKGIVELASSSEIAGGLVVQASDDRLRKIVFLTTPLTSTAWDGDARSTTAKTLIDMSAVFGLPGASANFYVEAVLVRLAARDSGSATSSAPYVALSPNNISGSAPLIVRPAGLPNDYIADYSGWVTCDVNGDLYFQTSATGTGTLDVWMEIWGYAYGIAAS